MRVSAVIVAAGQGQRFGALKQVVPILGVPVLDHTLARFQSHPKVNEIVLVLHPDLLKDPARWTQRFPKIRKVIPGGQTRAESVYRGADAATAEYLLVHDGVRPLVSARLIHQLVQVLAQAPVVVPVVPLRDTVKRCEDDVVFDRLDRERWVIVQTPQAVHRQVLLQAYANLGDDAWHQPDESTLVEKALGIKARAVPGDPQNLKITYPEDQRLAESLLARGIRVGFGVDLHRLAPGRPFVLGGVSIPFELGPVGHSDGDVLIHTLIDALLGATALGDIGRWFPDTDPRYAGAPSTDLLKHVVLRLEEKGYRILNVDLTVVLERPKIAPYVEAMRQTLAQALRLDPARVSIKAKTSEHVGPVGEGKAIQAFATALVLGPDTGFS